MTQTKLQNNINNNNIILGNKSGYCSKCLRELDGDRVRDADGNEFCDFECKREFHMENRKEMDDMFREWFKSGR
jgi:hypothetical protein